MKIRTPQHTQEARPAAEAPAVGGTVITAASVSGDRPILLEAQAPAVRGLAAMLPVASGATEVPNYDQPTVDLVGDLALGARKIVFHGGPHDFDRFDLGQVGAGEGASSYGWGLYFTDTSAVADYYRRTTSLSSMTIGGKPFKPHREIIEILGENRENLSQAVSALKAFITSSGYHNRYGHLTQAKQAIKAIQAGTLDLGTNRGTLYEVEIPNDGRYLLWDEPLQNQPPVVQAAIKKIIPMMNRRDYADFDQEQPCGHNLVYGLARTMMNGLGVGPGLGGKPVSAFLRKHGILGVKYLDQESRGGTVGKTYNYVLYDDADVRVVKKGVGEGPGHRDSAEDSGWIS